MWEWCSGPQMMTSLGIAQSVQQTQGRVTVPLLTCAPRLQVDMTCGALSADHSACAMRLAHRARATSAGVVRFPAATAHTPRIHALAAEKCILQKLAGGLGPHVLSSDVVQEAMWCATMNAAVAVRQCVPTSIHDGRAALPVWIHHAVATHTAALQARALVEAEIHESTQHVGVLGVEPQSRTACMLRRPLQGTVAYHQQAAIAFA